MTVIPIMTTADAVATVICTGPTGCGETSTDIDIIPVTFNGDDVTEAALTCPACGAETRIQRWTPDEAITELTQPDMQAARASRDVTAPGEWTIAVATMWQAIHFWPHNRHARHRDTLDRWTS